jgi:predicted transcriptional regulator
VLTQGGSIAANSTLEEGEIHDVLRNDRRRLTLEALREEDGQSTVRDLSEVVAARETGEDPPPRDKRQSVYVSLHQTHLPKLDELGIIEYDGDSKEVTLQQKVEEVEVYMEVVPEYGLSWAEAYFGLALLGLLTAVAAVIGVPGISSVSLTYLVIGYFLLQLIASAYHVVSHQDRTVFHRLRK